MIVADSGQAAPERVNRSRDQWLLGVGGVLVLVAISVGIVGFVASPGLRVEFFFDEAWRADMIRSADPLSRYRTNNAPTPPLWIVVMRATSAILPDGFAGLRLQNLAYHIALPVLAGVLAGFVTGVERRGRAMVASAAVCAVTALALTIGGSALYLNDYSFQAVAVAVVVLVCAIADRTGRGRAWAGAGIVALPLATLGGLVVLPALCAWWVLAGDRPVDRAGWTRRLAVPVASFLVVVVLYVWLYRPQVDQGLEGFWAAELLRGGTRSIAAVLVDIPRSLAVNVVPPTVASLRNVAFGLAIITAALAGLPTLSRAWKWLPVVVVSSWPIAILLSAVAGWPATFVRVNLPFAWLWYLSAIVGVAAVVGRLGRGWATAAYIAVLAAAVVAVPPRTPASNATFARGLYRDLDTVAASPFEHNVVLSYHFMSHFYTDDRLENMTGEGERFTVVREMNGDDALYVDTDQQLLDAGWRDGDAVWCVVPYEVGPEASEQACAVTLPGLRMGYSERLGRALIIGWFPETTAD